MTRKGWEVHRLCAEGCYCVLHWNSVLQLLLPTHFSKILAPYKNNRSLNIVSSGCQEVRFCLQNEQWGRRTVWHSAYECGFWSQTSVNLYIPQWYSELYHSLIVNSWATQTGSQIPHSKTTIPVWLVVVKLKVRCPL